MKGLALPLAIALSLAACAQTPVRPSAPLDDAVRTAAGIGARVPGQNEPYLDAAWFAEPLTADRATQAALLNNPLVRAELARLDVALAEHMQAGLLDNPMLSVMALRPNGGGRWELDYGLMQSLYDLLTRSRRVAVADAARQLTEAEVLANILAIVQDTEAAYYRATAATVRVRLIRARLDLDRKALVLTQGQSRQGLANGSRLLEAQSTVSMRKHELHSAGAIEVTARAELARQLGSPTAAVLRLPEQVPVPDLDGLDEARAQQLAGQQRPELHAGAAAVAEASAERELQSGMLRNTEPSLGPAGTRESGGTALAGFELRIALPVFDDGRARRDLAGARVREAGFRNEALRRNVPLEVEAALLTVAANRVALQHARQHRAQQQQLATLAMRDHLAGVGSFEARLAAEQVVLDSDEQLLDAEAALAESVVGLQRATGVTVAALLVP